MKDNFYDLLSSYSGEIPETDEAECNTERIKELVLKKTHNPKIRMKRSKAIVISFVAAALSVASISAVAYAGGFSYFKEILHHSSDDRNIPDSLPLVQDDDTGRMGNNITENKISFIGDENLDITAEGMYYDNNTLMISLEIVTDADTEFPENACIVPYFTKELSGIKSELSNQSGIGHEAALAKSDKPHTYYSTFYLTEENLAGSTIHISLRNFTTYEQTKKCVDKLHEIQQEWRDEANADSMTVEEWKQYWNDHDYDTKTQKALEELIDNSNPITKGEWSADIQIPSNISEPFSIQKYGYRVTADLLSFTLEDYNINDGGFALPVVILKDGTNIFDGGTNETDWIYENTEYQKDKYESIAYSFGNIFCYRKPHRIEDIESIIIYHFDYDDFRIISDTYVIYQAEE